MTPQDSRVSLLLQYPARCRHVDQRAPSCRHAEIFWFTATLLLHLLRVPDLHTASRPQSCAILTCHYVSRSAHPCPTCQNPEPAGAAQRSSLSHHSSEAGFFSISSRFRLRTPAAASCPADRFPCAVCSSLARVGWCIERYTQLCRQRAAQEHHHRMACPQCQQRGLEDAKGCR